MASWAEVVAFSKGVGEDGGGAAAGEGGGGGDAEVTYRVNGLLPVIVWDAEEQRRVVVRMRWGFPSRQDWRRPQPIHARAESVADKFPFRTPFAAGQRGIVVFKTFNEGEEVPTAGGKSRTVQWTVDPKDGQPRGFAFVWDRFEIAGLDGSLLACVMVTVPANELIRTRIMPNEPDPRMPAILADEDWATWLGEAPAHVEAVTATLKTVEGVHWEAAPEPKKPRPGRR